MSSSATVSDATQRADQIAHRFFSKVTSVIANARSTPGLEPSHVANSKIDKWFNLETTECEAYRDQLRPYRSISTIPYVPPLEIQILLSVPELASNQVLVLLDSSSRKRIDPIPRYILLESWTLSFPLSSRYDAIQADVALPTVYKHSISLFRSLFTLLRVLPVWDLFKLLRRRAYNSRNGGLAIEVAVGEPFQGILGFDTPFSPTAPPLSTSTHSFLPINHPFGSLILQARYLTTPTFQIDTLESLLSSRFLTDDEFTPTLSKNSLHSTSIPGSLPLRTSLPRSPPKSPASIADRFVVSRAGFGSPSSLPRNVPLPMSRQVSGASGTSPKDRLELQARQRAESLLSGGELPFPSPLPIRRPSLNSVHPFKSSTVSSGSPSSTSLRQPSPLATGPSLLSRATQSPRILTSPLPRPSPPYLPSSLGDRAERRSLGTGSSAEITGGIPIVRPTGAKRYSSSFSYRHATAGGAGSEGSGGSADKDRKDGATSYMSTAVTDGDETGSQQGGNGRSPTLIKGRERRASAPVMTLALLPIEPPALSSLSQLDEALAAMSRMFQTSLQGLGTLVDPPQESTKGKERSHYTLPSVGTRSTLPVDTPEYPSRPSSSPYSRTHYSPSSIAFGARDRLGSLPQGRRSFDTIASDDSPRAGAGSGGSEEIIGRIEIDDRPPPRRRR